LDTLGKLGPWGRTMIFKDVDLAQQEFLQTDQEKWLLRLTTLAEDYREELEDTPFPGRPSGTTLAIKKARRSVLKRCSAFLAPFTIDQNGVLSNLVLEMARAIHRTELEPDLPMESQLFRKEWKEMQDVQKQDDRTNFLNN